MAILGVIVIDSCISLIDYGEFAFLWRTARVEAVLFLLTVIATLGLGIMWGILFALLMSLLHVIYAVSVMPLFNVARARGGAESTERFFEDVALGDPVICVRVPGALFFGSVHHVSGMLAELMAHRKAQRVQSRQAVVFDMSSVTDIDATALHQLQQSLGMVAGDSALLVLLADVKALPHRRLIASGTDKLLRAPGLLALVDHAMTYAAQWVDGQR